MATHPPESLAALVSASAPREIASLVLSAANGCIRIASAMRESDNLLGYSRSQNVQGETQADLDILADRTMTEAFFSSGVVASLVSEEQTELVVGKNPAAPFAVAHDPLDGSSNIPFNLPVGTIFSAFRRPQLSRTPCNADYFQSARAIVCAGYAVYGLKTQFVVSWGDGVMDCVLDQTGREFIVRNRALKAQEDGQIFSVNEGSSASWEPRIQGFIEDLKRVGGFSGRYVGSLVSDFDRNMRKGGIYLYPADAKNTHGKLRALYECLPLAFIAEHSGGASFDGKQSVMDRVPSAIHERLPLFIGSKQLVSRLLRALE